MIMNMIHERFHAFGCIERSAVGDEWQGVGGRKDVPLGFAI